MADFDLLDSVNLFTNREIKYTKEPKDNWQYPQKTLDKKTGDCEDYAILKAWRLFKQGVPCSDMSLGYFATPLDTRHVMLLVKGTYKKLFSRKIVDCTYLLDNRTNDIYRLGQTKDKLLSQVKVDKYVNHPHGG